MFMPKRKAKKKDSVKRKKMSKKLVWYRRNLKCRIPKKGPAIHFIITGGTIDSYYEGSLDTVVPLKETVIPAYVDTLSLREKIRFTKVCMKDSRQLTIRDLKHVVKSIEKSKYRSFIVTHGTYTMPDTARYLEANLKRKNITIILTGSMIPLTGFSPSDAPFNLGYAIANVNKLDPGIYVCMNGRIFKPTEVYKLMSKGRFVSIFGEK
jgi:L-asparaginase